MKKDSCKSVQKNLKLEHFKTAKPHKKWSFPLRISSVNVTKSAENCGFGHINEEILNGKLHFVCSVCFISFKIFVLKTTSTYFALTYYYYTNLYVSSVTEFSKEQNKQSTSTVYHKHYRYRTCFNRFTVRLLSKIAVTCRNYNYSWRRD